MRPPCYGQYWEGIAGSDCVTGDCKALDECLARFASGALVAAQLELGQSADIEALAEKTSIKPEAILLAINFQINAGIVVPYADAKGVVTTPTNGFTTIEDTEPAVVIPTGTEEPEPVPLATEEPKPEPVPTVIEPVAGPSPAVVENTALEKAEGALNPTLAGSVEGVTGPAKPDMGGIVAFVTVPVSKSKSKKPRKSPKLPRKPREKGIGRKWGSDCNLDRWLRERERSPLIAQLLPGMKLKRLWGGVIHDVIVQKHHYEYQGVQYPTLSTVVIAIAGAPERPKQKTAKGDRPVGVRKTPNWSAVRFFKLDLLMGVKAPKYKKKAKPS